MSKLKKIISFFGWVLMFLAISVCIGWLLFIYNAKDFISLFSSLSTMLICYFTYRQTTENRRQFNDLKSEKMNGVHLNSVKIGIDISNKYLSKYNSKDKKTLSDLEEFISLFSFQYKMILKVIGNIDDNLYKDIAYNEFSYLRLNITSSIEGLSFKDLLMSKHGVVECEKIERLGLEHADLKWLSDNKLKQEYATKALAIAYEKHYQCDEKIEKYDITSLFLSIIAMHREKPIATEHYRCVKHSVGYLLKYRYFEDIYIAWRALGGKDSDLTKERHFYEILMSK